MNVSDFPGAFVASLYASIGAALLSAIIIAVWSLRRRRGALHQVARALLTCLVALGCDTVLLLWFETRLAVYGPTLGGPEVTVALATQALAGWAAPLSAMGWFILTAAPTLADAAQSVAPASLDAPGRKRRVFEDGARWGALIPLEASEGYGPITLTMEVTLIGRDAINDVVMSDGDVSRRHAELRWEQGRVALVDYGGPNGTQVNQRPAHGRVWLRDGDVVTLGARSYQLILTDPSSDAPATTKQRRPQLGEQEQTRKTSSVSGSFIFEGPLLRLALTQQSGVAQQVWILRAPLTTIGRDAACSLTLSDSSVSRMHAQITRQPAGYFIADLQSSNGVFLNGERLTAPAQLHAGDTLALGDVTLRCEEASPAKSASPSPAPASDAQTPGVADAADHTAGASSDDSRLTPQEGETLSRAANIPAAPVFSARIAPRNAPQSGRPHSAPPHRERPTSPDDPAPAI